MISQPGVGFYSAVGENNIFLKKCLFVPNIDETISGSRKFDVEDFVPLFVCGKTIAKRVDVPSNMKKRDVTM